MTVKKGLSMPLIGRSNQGRFKEIFDGRMTEVQSPDRVIGFHRSIWLLLSRHSRPPGWFER
jgi:hypothetical protein